MAQAHGAIAHGWPKDGIGRASRRPRLPGLSHPCAIFGLDLGCFNSRPPHKGSDTRQYTPPGVEASRPQDALAPTLRRGYSIGEKERRAHKPRRAAFGGQPSRSPTPGPRAHHEARQGRRQRQGPWPSPYGLASITASPPALKVFYIKRGETAGANLARAGERPPQAATIDF